MKTQKNILYSFICGLLWGFSMFLVPSAAFANSVPPDTPPCQDCCDCADAGSDGVSGPCSGEEGSGFLSFSEGNLSETYPVFTVKNASKTLLEMRLRYNSFNADGSNFRADTVMGFGWTHSYNVFLTEYRMDIYKHGASGRTRKFDRNPDGTYDSPEGSHETLTKNPDGTFEIRLKDGTRYLFEKLNPAPFLMPSPPLYLTRITDRNDLTTLLEYGADSLLARVVGPYGRTIHFTYNGDGKLSGIGDPAGRWTLLEYGPKSYDLQAIEDPAGNVTRFAYNLNHQMIMKTDRAGRSFTYGYNSRSKPVSIADGSGRVIMALSNAANWAVNLMAFVREGKRRYIPATTFKTDGRGHAWQYAYNREGYITRMAAPDGAVTVYTYDPATLDVATETDPNNHTTSFGYDEFGNRIRVTDAMGNVTTFIREPVFHQVTQMTDPSGRITAYEYDAAGNLVRETDPAGHIRQWSYDACGNLLTETDPNGNTTAHAYDAMGNRVRTMDPLGHEVVMTHDAMGRVVSLADKNGHVTIYEYDLLDRLVQKTDAAGGVQTFVYDGEGNCIRSVDRNGNATLFEYNRHDMPVRSTNALGHSVVLAYDDNENLTAVTDRNGNTTVSEYDTRNRLIRTIDPEGGIRTKNYDGAGNVIAETDANGNTTAYEYDALNRMVRRTDGEGGLGLFEYAAPGAPPCCGPAPGSRLFTRTVNENGNVTFFKYDLLDRLVQTVRKEGDTADLIDPTDAVTEFTYDAVGNRLSVTDPTGSRTEYHYNAQNRLVRQVDAEGSEWTYTYDGEGNVVAEVSPTGNVLAMTYDPLNRVIREEDGIGLLGEFQYDPEGRLTVETDGNGNTVSYAYDERNRLVATTDAKGESMAYHSDPAGNLVEIVDREGNRSTFSHDRNNRLLRTTDALGNTTIRAYDAAGNLVQVTDARGNSTAYAYDGLNRPVRETYADGGEKNYVYDPLGNLAERTDPKGLTTRYVYDDLNHLVRRDYPLGPDDVFSYHPSGLLLSAERDGWMVTFEYDAVDRLIRTVQNSRTVTYLYDIPGRSRTVTYPGGRMVTEWMDLRSRIGWIEDSLLGAAAAYVYDDGNRATSRVFINGVDTAYGYDENNRITDLEHVQGGTRVAGFDYGYDREGNRLFERKRHLTARSEAYSYDALYRLIDHRVGELSGSMVPVPSTQTAYSLDALGNWEEVIRDGVTENRTHNSVNELTAVDFATLAYDDNGNLVENDRFQFAYDEENRLTAVLRKADGRTVGQYRYDALGRRISKVADPATTPLETLFFYDGARVVEEQNPSAVTLATYVYGNYIDDVLTMNRSGQDLFFHANSLHSVAALTDDAAQVVERYDYDAYGTVTVTDGAGDPLPISSWGTASSSVENPYMFTGRRFDEETGLYHYRNRMYDSVAGRFLQRDPKGYFDGMNLYEYVSGSPVNLLDPLGLNGFRKKGSWFRMDGDTRPDGSVIKTKSGNQWRKEGGTWYKYEKVPPKPEPPKPEPPKPAPPKPEGQEPRPADPEDNAPPEPQPPPEAPAVPPRHCPPPGPPAPPRSTPPQPPVNTPPQQPVAPPPQQPVTPPPQPPAKLDDKPRTINDWVDEKTRKFCDDYGLDYKDPTERGVARNYVIAGVKAGDMTIPEAIGQIGNIANQGRPAPGVRGGPTQSTIQAVVQFLFGP